MLLRQATLITGMLHTIQLQAHQHHVLFAMNRSGR